MGWGMSWLQHTTPMTHGIIIIRLDLCSPKINHNTHVFREMELTVLRAMTWEVWLSISVLHFCTLTHVHVQMLPITYEFSIPSHFCLSVCLLMHLSMLSPKEGGPQAYVGYFTSIAFPTFANLTKNLGPRVGTFVFLCRGMGPSHIVPSTCLCADTDFSFINGQCH